MAASIFVRSRKAFVSNFEIGLSGLEARCRGSLARGNVREMDDALEDARRQRFEAEERRDRATADESRLRSEIVEWADKAAYAVSKDRVDLAERALIAQLDAETKLEKAGESRAAAESDVQRIQTLMDDIQAQRSEMAARARTIEAGRNKPADRASPSPEQRAEVARANFDRLLEDLGETAAPAIDQPDAAADLEALRRSDEIERRLAELKRSKVKSSGKGSSQR